MIKEFFTDAPMMAWAIVSVISALLAISIMWTKLQWWWHNTWYSFPLIGKISSLSKDTNKDSTDNTWFKAERTLCRDYKKFIRIQDEYDFDEKITYITKAGDNGRKSIPGLIWLLTVGLVFVEAMGFSYVLAGYTLPGASENLQQLGAYGIAFLISVILVAFTHFTGSELYKSRQIQGTRQAWNDAGRPGQLSTGTVPLARPQSSDDDLPGYKQLANRVGTDPTYYATIGTAIFVTVVAIGATYVRGQVLEKQLHQQTMGLTGQGANLPAKPISDGLDMSGKDARPVAKLSAADAAENQRAIDKAQQDDISIDRHGGWGTFIVLAFIFVFLQILGVFFGFRWGFAGKESEAAFRAIGAGRYASYSEVREHYKTIADTAQSKLEHLQQKLMRRNSISGNHGLHTTKTFYDFMDIERDRETKDRLKERQHAAQRGEMGKAPLASHSAASAPAPGRVPHEDSLEAVMDRLNAMGDNKKAKIDFINLLSGPMQVQVKQKIKDQKEQADNKARQDAELDALLS